MKTLKEIVGNIVNCTPHAVSVLLDNDNTETVIEPSGIVIRVDTTQAEELSDGIFDSEGFLPPELPAPQEGIFLLVSLAVASAMKEHGIHRPDVVVGGTGPNDNPRRHEKGFVTGIRRVKFANR